MNRKIRLMTGAVLLVAGFLAMNSLSAQLPVYVDNATDADTVKYFPPVFNQVGNSCGPSSSTYYGLTFMTAKARDWDVQNDLDGTKKFSPKFIYNHINGTNAFTYMAESYTMLYQSGAPTLSEYPNDSNTSEWCKTGSIWRGAISNRLANYGSFDVYRADGGDQGIEQLKEYINNGYLLNYWTGISSWQYKTVSDNLEHTDDNDFVGQHACYNVSGNSGGHFMIVTGYHDNIWIDCDGDSVMDADEIGAIKIVNSWGTGWKNSGFCWVAYKVLKSKPGTWPALDDYYWMDVHEYYQPDIVAEFTLNAERREHMRVKLGIGDLADASPDTYIPSSTSYYKDLYDSGGAYNFNGASASGVDGTFALDFSAIMVKNTSKRWFLQVYDDTAGQATSVNGFSLVKADGTQWTATVATPVPPQTVDAATTNFYIEYNLGGDRPAVTAPVSGAVWAVGDSNNITWATNTAGANVKIELYRKGLKVSDISSSTENDGTFSWSVPAGTTGASNYRIRVTDLDTPTLYDESANFRILAPVATFPANESFEDTYFDAWMQASDDEMDWTRDAFGTPTATTGPSAASAGAYYMYTEANSNSNKTASLLGLFNFSGLSEADLSFDYHMYGSDMGDLNVDVYDGEWHNSVWSLSGQQHGSNAAAWTTATVSLDAYVGSSLLKIRFRGVVGANFNSDMAIDNVNVTGTERSGSVPWDFNGDGKSDVAAESGSESGFLYFMNGITPSEPASVYDKADKNWTVAKFADFNGDGKCDILWQHELSGQALVYIMNGSSITDVKSIYTGGAWKINEIGDFNGDGKDDILWTHPTSGTTAMHIMNGANVETYHSFPAKSGWLVTKVADFDGDGKADILWEINGVQGHLWLMSGGTVNTQGAIYSRSPSWTLKLFGDFNGDGTSDILWETADGKAGYVYLMNGTSILPGSGYSYIKSDLSWEIVNAADYSGDGKTDILWEHEVSGSGLIHIMNGSTASSNGIVYRLKDQNPASKWNVVKTLDFNGDAKSDMLWENAGSKKALVYLMNGLSVSSSGTVYNNGSGWSILKK